MTPPDFLAAVKHLLGIERFAFDLAADASNSVAGDAYYGEHQNSLIQPWSFDGWLWLNPPRGCDHTPWVKKAALASKRQGTNITVLLPARVSSEWWTQWVDGKAWVLFLTGMKGQGAGEYTEDVALLLYGSAWSHIGPTYRVWNWRFERW